MATKTSWESVTKASLKAYGHHSKVGSTIVEFINLLQSRDMSVPLAVPSEVGADNIGLIASKPLNKGELILSIPHTIWRPHSSQTALSNFKVIGERMGSLEDKILGGSSKGAGNLAPLAALSLQVLFTGCAKEDRAYLNWLHAARSKQDISTAMPSFWSPAQRKEIKNEGIINTLERLPMLAVAIHNTLFGGSEESVRVHDVLYGLSLVQSRATTPSKSLPDYPFTMVPYFDLLNHSLQPNCVHSFSKQEQCFNVVAQRDIETGEECTISYGELSNADLLRLYGFALDDNPHDTVDVQFKRHEGEEPVRFRLSAQDPVPRSLLKYAASTFQELMPGEAAERVQLAGLDWLIHCLSKKEGKESVMELMEEPDWSRHVSCVRRGEKRILKGSLEALNGIKRDLLD